MIWDHIRAIPTTRDKQHESLYRSYHVLLEASKMLKRGDSSETVQKFIEWCYPAGSGSALMTSEVAGEKP